MRTIPEVAEDIKSILNNIERTEECTGETLVDINELVDEILTISCIDTTEIRNKAIDEAMETSARAICVGCGYLDGHKCNYKGANCGVSKPMLETVVGALERLKGGAE